MASAISAVSVTGARSATFSVSALAGDNFLFSALAAAILDPTIGGAAGNAQTNALYKFFNDNAAANLATTLAEFASNGVTVSVIGVAGQTAAANLTLAAAQIVATAVALVAGTQIRISLASSISA